MAGRDVIQSGNSRSWEQGHPSRLTWWRWQEGHCCPQPFPVSPGLLPPSGAECWSALPSLELLGFPYSTSGVVGDPLLAHPQP